MLTNKEIEVLCYCRGLPVYRHFLLLYRLLQRYWPHPVCHAAGHHRRVWRACAGIVFYEHPVQPVFVPHRPCHADVLHRTATALPWFYGVPEKEKSAVMMQQ